MLKNQSFIIIIKIIKYLHLYLRQNFYNRKPINILISILKKKIISILIIFNLP